MIKDYNHLPLGKYLEIQEVATSDKEDIDKQVSVIAILADLTEDEVLNLPLMDYKRLAAESSFLEVPVQVPANIAKTYNLNGWELVPTTDIRKMTTAQYIDFQTFSQQDNNNLVGVMSCFLIPKGKKYNEDYDIVELQNTIKDYLCVPHCLSLAAFFLTRFSSSILAMLTYCKWMTKMNLKGEQKKMMLKRIQELKEMLTNGDGSLAWMR